MHNIIKISSTLLFITLITAGHDVSATLQNEIGVVAGTAGNKLKEFRKNRDQVLFEQLAVVQSEMNKIRADVLNPELTPEVEATLKEEFELQKREFSSILLTAEVKHDLGQEVLRINEAAQKLVVATRKAGDEALAERASKVQYDVSNLSQDIPGFGSTEELGEARAQLDGYIKEIGAIQKELDKISSSETGGGAAAAAAVDNT